jgi:hypothetical protein
VLILLYIGCSVLTADVTLSGPDILSILHRNFRRHALRQSHEMLLDFVYLDLFREKSFENQLDTQRTDVMFRETS